MGSSNMLIKLGQLLTKFGVEGEKAPQMEVSYSPPHNSSLAAAPTYKAVSNTDLYGKHHRNTLFNSPKNTIKSRHHTQKKLKL